MSGAGKSTAMQVFEDAGYFCVDNLPPEMLEPLAHLFEHQGSTVDRACVVSDTRGGEYFERLSDVLDGMPIKPRILFLDADDDTLLTRYKETRRRHPLARNGNVTSGIARERRLLEPLRARADDVLDTTAVPPAELRRRIAREFLDDHPVRLAVTFASFGHKHGPARDADLAFDVRFLPNPHYVDDLRPLTGHDPRVVEHVGHDGRLAEFYDRLLPLLDYLLPQYVAEGKSHLVIAIGCTGGRHRSVAIAEHLAARYKDDGRFTVEVMHRDVDRAPVRRSGGAR
jgi:RNase adapter protein RapZ